MLYTPSDMRALPLSQHNTNLPPMYLYVMCIQGKAPDCKMRAPMLTGGPGAAMAHPDMGPYPGYGLPPNMLPAQGPSPSGPHYDQPWQLPPLGPGLPPPPQYEGELTSRMTIVLSAICKGPMLKAWLSTCSRLSLVRQAKKLKLGSP